RKNLILRRPRKRPSRRTHGRPSNASGRLCKGPAFAAAWFAAFGLGRHAVSLTGQTRSRNTQMNRTFVRVLGENRAARVWRAARVLLVGAAVAATGLPAEPASAGIFADE